MELELDETLSLPFWEHITEPLPLTLTIIFGGGLLLVVLAALIYLAVVTPRGAMLDVSPNSEEAFRGTNPYAMNRAERNERLQKFSESRKNTSFVGRDDRGKGRQFFLAFGVLFTVVVLPVTALSWGGGALALSYPVGAEARNKDRAAVLIDEVERVYGLSLTEDEALALVDGSSFEKTAENDERDVLGAAALDVEVVSSSGSSETVSLAVLLVYYVPDEDEGTDITEVSESSETPDADSGDGKSDDGDNEEPRGEWQLRAFPPGVSVADVTGLSEEERAAIPIYELPRADGE